MKSQGLVKHRSQVCLHSVGEPPRLCDVLLGGGDGGEVVQLQEGERRGQGEQREAAQRAVHHVAPGHRVHRARGGVLAPAAAHAQRLHGLAGREGARAEPNQTAAVGDRPLQIHTIDR